MIGTNTEPVTLSEEDIQALADAAFCRTDGEIMASLRPVVERLLGQQNRSDTTVTGGETRVDEGLRLATERWEKTPVSSRPLINSPYPDVTTQITEGGQ